MIPMIIFVSKKITPKYTTGIRFIFHIPEPGYHKLQLSVSVCIHIMTHTAIYQGNDCIKMD